ncbi:hypothetical protein Glove_529g32 [Diversispora epigaea]|uniref:Nuclear transport factor 2 n=1 Tax=Diversispora epigaea TaxID=1348612 RepID=A0A397GH51_9GLOM|nr:hypothetical protein Glove_529g32 [Diversispora epigaea]
MSDANAFATQFINYYYSVFCSDRNNLRPLYREQSMLTFEGAPHQGVNNIIEKMTSLPFQRVAHRIASLDAQPSISNGIFVVVTGELLVDDEQNPQRFTQAFQLIPEGSTYWVLNDIFRLNYG